jgi:uncharacterized protein
MANVARIFVSPVKSLRLRAVDEAEVTPDGVVGDRRFLLLDDADRVLTMRLVGRLAQVESSEEDGELVLRLPNGEVVRGRPDDGEPVEFTLWRRTVAGRVVRGPFADALATHAGRPVRLVRTTTDLACRDAYPVSLLAQESAEELGRQAGVPPVDPRRFRPNVLVAGVRPHEEDGWIGRRVAVGDALLDVTALDVRCVLTTRNPETGERDADTLRWLAGYRPAHEDGVTCGVYARVARPGRVRVGDPVYPVAA